MNTKKYRNSRYINLVKSYVTESGHVSNTDILNSIRTKYPEVSATTIHRITTRLCEQGVISEAPTNSGGSMRFDSNTTPHDHFVCKSCDRLRDLNVTDKFVSEISKFLGDCQLTGRLIIYGNCSKCIKQ